MSTNDRHIADMEDENVSRMNESWSAIRRKDVFHVADLMHIPVKVVCREIRSLISAVEQFVLFQTNITIELTRDEPCGRQRRHQTGTEREEGFQGSVEDTRKSALSHAHTS